MSETSIEKATATAETVLSMLAPVIATAVPDGAEINAGVAAAGSVANAVEASLPHNTAVSDIGAGLVALAGTPVVQSSPVIAAKLHGLALLWADLESLFGVKA